MEYGSVRQIGSGWYFTRWLESGDTSVSMDFGPYPSEYMCWEHLEQMRKQDALNSPNQALQQNLSNNPTWRSMVQDIFGTTSIEAYPPRGSKG